MTFSIGFFFSELFRLVALICTYFRTGAPNAGKMSAIVVGMSSRFQRGAARAVAGHSAQDSARMMTIGSGMPSCESAWPRAALPAMRRQRIVDP